MGAAKKVMRILVVGGSGMLGHTAYRVFAGTPGIEAFATLRSEARRNFFPGPLQAGLFAGIDATAPDTIANVLDQCRPDVVVNCVGLVKQLKASSLPLAALPINSVFPHRLAKLCSLVGARLIHLSTDCVFSGRRGSYVETDFPDADDLYGRSKLLGEVDEPHAITLRTSIIGREPENRNGLVEWLLSKNGRVRGFTNAVFSGLTTDELSRVILDRVLPYPDLHGVWHVSAAPITKHDLLVLLRDAYGLSVDIEPDPVLVLDRSLDSSRFKAATGYTPPDWPQMVTTMRQQGE